MKTREALFNFSGAWKRILSEELQKHYIAHLITFLEEEYSNRATLFPPREKIFSALIQAPFEKVNVVIIAAIPAEHF